MSPRVSNIGERVAVLENEVDTLKEDVRHIGPKVERLDRKTFMWSVLIVALIVVSKATSPEVIDFAKHLLGL